MEDEQSRPAQVLDDRRQVRSCRTTPLYCLPHFLHPDHISLHTRPAHSAHLYRPTPSHSLYASQVSPLSLASPDMPPRKAAAKKATKKAASVEHPAEEQPVEEQPEASTSAEAATANDEPQAGDDEGAAPAAEEEEESTTAGGSSMDDRMAKMKALRQRMVSLARSVSLIARLPALALSAC